MSDINERVASALNAIAFNLESMAKRDSTTRAALAADSLMTEVKKKADKATDSNHKAILMAMFDGIKLMRNAYAEA